MWDPGPEFTRLIYPGPGYYGGRGEKLGGIGGGRIGILTFGFKAALR